MKQLIFGWFLGVALYAVAGFGFLGFICKLSKRLSLRNFSLGQVILSGAAWVTCLLQVLHLFFPVSHSPLRWLTGILACLPAILLFASPRSSLRNEILESFHSALRDPYTLARVVLVDLLAIPVLYCALSPPGDYDAGLYHVQTIKWLKEYSIVPGLGNLQGRFAHNSSSFLLNAFWDGGVFTDRSYHLVNGILFLSLIDTLLFIGWQARSWLVGFFCLAWVWIACTNSVPSYIFIYQPNEVAYFYLIAALGLLFYSVFELESSLGKKKEPLITGLFFLFFALTVKLYAAPYLLLVPFLVFAEPSHRNLIVKSAAAFFGVALIPWLVRNVILSGWLVYPVPVFDIFPFDWKIPKVNVMAMSDWIRSWAYAPRAYPSDVFAHGSLAAMWEWTKANAQAEPFRSMFSYYAISTALLLAGWFSKRFRDWKWVAVLVFSWVPVLFFIYSAPVMRLGRIHIEFATILNWVFFLAIASKVLSPLFGRSNWNLFQPISQSCIRRWLPVALTLAVLWFSVGNRAGGLISSYRGFRADLSRLPEVQVTTQKMSSGLDIYVPVTSDQCWNAPLPCMPQHFIYRCLPGPTDIALRGDGLGSGFKVVKQEIQKVDLNTLWKW